MAVLMAAAGFATSASGVSAALPLTYYPSRAAFNAAEPGLPLEVFQPINWPAVIPAPLSSTTNNGDFVPGSILPGIDISNKNTQSKATGLYADSSSVACNWFADPMILSFSPAVSAVGADFFASSGGSSWAGSFTAVIYNGTATLGVATFSEGAGQTTFFGLTSTLPVTSIEISFHPTTDVDWAPHVENIAFGGGAFWYVDGIHGNDHNDCKTAQTACRTIAHAIGLAAPGDSLIAAAATYTENLNIESSLNLTGAGASKTILDGGGAARVVSILNSAAVVSLTGVTIRNGIAAGGGGILNWGTLTLTKSALRGNIAASSYSATGAGVYNSGTLTINDSTISGNTGSTNFMYGGGIYNSGAVTIDNSTLSGNSALGFTGGGGGGIYNASGTVKIDNSTISGNSGSGYGGGGIYNSGTVTLQNSIVANSPSGGNCYGSMTSNGYNVSGDNTCYFNGAGDLNSTDPKLGRLQNNGGPTQTQAPLTGSPAIDAGNPNGCTDGQGHPLKTDQRGLPRHDKEDTGGCDMGAVERQKD